MEKSKKLDKEIEEWLKKENLEILKEIFIEQEFRSLDDIAALTSELNILYFYF